MTRTYILLALAILAEVIATTALARSDSFTRLGPSVVAALGYGVAFWLLSFPLRVMPTGIVYAIWSGMGIVLDFAAILGLALILAWVVVINVFSKSIMH